jgi:hypothetical protein
MSENKFDLTEEDVVFLEQRLQKLFDKLKDNALKLTQTTDQIEEVIKKDIDLTPLELLYAKEFGFAAENYELSEIIKSVLNKIFLYDERRFMARRIESEYEKFVLTKMTDA